MLGWPWVCMYTHRDCVCVLERELDGVHTPVFCYVQLARKWNLMLCQMLTDSQKPCSCGERGEGKRTWMEKEMVRRDEIDNRQREKEREIQKKVYAKIKLETGCFLLPMGNTYCCWEFDYLCALFFFSQRYPHLEMRMKDDEGWKQRISWCFPLWEEKKNRTKKKKLPNANPLEHRVQEKKKVESVNLTSKRVDLMSNNWFTQHITVSSADEFNSSHTKNLTLGRF